MFYAELDDRWYEFTTRPLLEAFLRAYRDAVPRISPPNNVYPNDGNTEAWQQLALERVDADPALTDYRDIIFADWSDAGHSRWVVQSPTEDIIAWAKATQ